MHLLISGTGTDIGKTHLTQNLVLGLRGLGRSVWVHKPIACGAWQDDTAEDARVLAPLVGDGQDPLTLCPLQFRAACSPHLAGRLDGSPVDYQQLLDNALRLMDDTHDLVIEGAGGLLSPLADDGRGARELARDLGLPVVIVTRPDLGTLHVTAATVEVARHAGLHLLGLVINEPHPVDPADPAIATACDELTACTGLPILAYMEYTEGTPTDATGAQCARAILAATGNAPPPC